MAELKLVINDTKTGKSYSKTADLDLVDQKLGSNISGDQFGLKGYELQITGGSDTAGFPMRKDIQGKTRKAALLSSGTGIKIKRKGMRKRKTVRGNTVGTLIAQVNLKITKFGSEPLEKALGIEKKEEETPKEEPKTEAPKIEETKKEEPKEDIKEEKPKKE